LKQNFSKNLIDMEKRTLFEIEYWEEKDGIMQWVVHNNMYWGDISHIDIEKDWRTCDVKNKRRNAKILEIIK